MILAMLRVTEIWETVKVVVNVPNGGLRLLLSSALWGNKHIDL